MIAVTRNDNGTFTITLAADDLKGFRRAARQQGVTVATVMESALQRVVTKQARDVAEEQTRALLSASPSARAQALAAIGFTDPDA